MKGYASSQSTASSYAWRSSFNRHSVGFLIIVISLGSLDLHNSHSFRFDSYHTSFKDRLAYRHQPTQNATTTKRIEEKYCEAVQFYRIYFLNIFSIGETSNGNSIQFNSIFLMAQTSVMWIMNGIILLNLYNLENGLRKRNHWFGLISVHAHCTNLHFWPIFFSKLYERYIF